MLELVEVRLIRLSFIRCKIIHTKSTFGREKNKQKRFDNFTKFDLSVLDLNIFDRISILFTRFLSLFAK